MSISDLIITFVLFLLIYVGDSKEYFYLSSQPSSDHDHQSFIETVNALNTLGFSQEDQDLVWKLLASILHLGNIEIVDKTQKNPGDGDSCYISVCYFIIKYKFLI